MFAQATGVRERKTRCVFFPLSRKKRGETLFPRCLRVIYGNRVSLIARFFETEEEARRTRRGEEIEAEQRYRLIGGGGRLA